MLDLDGKYAALHAELRKPNVGTALFWQIIRTDGEIFAFTDHDKDLTMIEDPTVSPVNQITFSSLSPFSGQARRMVEGLAVDNISVTGLIDGGSPSIGLSEAEVLAEIWHDATVTIWLGVWTAPSAGLLPLNEGTLGPMTFRQHTFEAEMRGIAERLQKKVNRTYKITCDAVLGDTRCGVNLDGSPSFRRTTSVAAVTDNRVFEVVLTGEDADTFQYGICEFTSGNNLGLKREIINHELSGNSPNTDVVTLLVPMPYAVEVGDTVTLTFGCDKLGATCLGTFNNIVNFRGFNFMPTQETVLETPDAKT